MLIDLTHTLTHDAPTWGGKPGFNLEVKLDYQQCMPPAQLRVQQVKMHAGIGTHIDAPAHFVKGGRTVEKLTFDELISVPLVVIDVSKKSHEEYLIALDDIHHDESSFGAIPQNAFIAFYTGWSQFWGDQKQYRNIDSAGNMRFPGVKAEVIDYLLPKNIVGIGVDTLSPDDPADDTFPVHRLMLQADKYIIENVANLDQAPQRGARCSIVPPKMQGATEAPVRLYCEY